MPVLVAIREGSDPGEQPDLRTAVSEAVGRRASFNRHVEAHLPKTAGARDVLGDIVGGAVGEAVSALIEGFVTIWKTWRESRDLQRQPITTRIEAQRWLAFTNVPAAL